MNKVKKNIILARTSPRIKRSVMLTVRERVGLDKCATGSPTDRVELKTGRRFKLGQWNVKGLNSLGKLSILSSELERLNINICGLSETKWSGFGHFMTLDGHTVLFSGSKEREHHRVVIWIHERVASYLTTRSSSRVNSATFAAKPRDVTLIQYYAPTVDKPDEEIEDFYKEVDHVITETPKQNLLVITGDFNARVGEDAGENDVLGKYGHGQRNDKGQTLVDFCAEHKLFITNTIFRLHNRKSPDGITRA